MPTPERHRPLAALIELAKKQEITLGDMEAWVKGVAETTVWPGNSAGLNVNAYVGFGEKEHGNQYWFCGYLTDELYGGVFLCGKHYCSTILEAVVTALEKVEWRWSEDGPPPPYYVDRRLKVAQMMKSTI